MGRSLEGIRARNVKIGVILLLPLKCSVCSLCKCAPMEEFDYMKALVDCLDGGESLSVGETEFILEKVRCNQPSIT